MNIIKDFINTVELEDFKKRQLEKAVVKEWARPLRFLLTIGWYMVVSLLAPTLLGRFWLDPKFNRDDHLFTLIGLGIGTVIAFYGLFRMLRRYKAEQDELNKDKK